MFDVDNKRAVDRLAAVMVMLERREAEARAEYQEAVKHVTAITAEREAASVEELTNAQYGLGHASGRHAEALDAITAVRELTADL